MRLGIRAGFRRVGPHIIYNKLRLQHGPTEEKDARMLVDQLQPQLEAKDGLELIGEPRAESDVEDEEHRVRIKGQ